MSEFQIMKPEDWNQNVFQTIGKDWLLITAKKGNQVNTMTASWGGMGILWGKPVVYIFIRPQRYTREFVESADSFSISILGEEHRKTLSYFGTVSGRDEDKIGKSGLALTEDQNVPYFADARAYLICRKLYVQNLEPTCFIDASCDEKWYPQKDYHTMYIAEIIRLGVR